MANTYASAARGIEAGFGMALRADEMAEQKRHRALLEGRQAQQDARAAETHDITMRQLRTSLDEHEEDRATKGVTARLVEIERQSTAAQAAGGKVDPALAQEHGQLTDLLAGRARRARGVLERLSPAAQTGGDAPNPAVGAAGATDTDAGAIAQQARNYWSNAAAGRVNPMDTPGPELRMHLAAATGVKVDELPTVVEGARDVQVGMETGNQGMIVSGMNKAMLGRLKVGIGGPSPYGGQITRKEIIGLDPAIDAAGNAHPNRFFVRMRVYVAGVSPDGGELYYDAPMTRNGSTEESDNPVAIDIKRGFDWLGNMNLLSEIVKHPDIAPKLKTGDDGKSDAYIDNLRNLTKPHPKQIVDQRTGRVTLLYPDGTTKEAVAPSAKPLTPLDQVKLDEANSRIDKNKAQTARTNAEVAGTLPARPKAKGAGGGAAAGGGAKNLKGITAANKDLRGEEFLATLDPETAQSVRSIAAGNDPKGFSSRAGERGRLEAMAQLYSEGYTSKGYPTAAATEKGFAAGVESRKLRSFNVAIQHLDTLEKLGEALENPTDLPLINKLSLMYKEQTGKAAPTNFEAARDLIADEIVAAVVPGVGALADRKAAADKIKAARSMSQIRGSIGTYHELLGGQLVGLEQQYKAGGGAKDFRATFLNPRARQIADKVAPRTAGSAGSAAAPAAAPAGPYSDAEKERRYQEWKARQAQQAGR